MSKILIIGWDGATWDLISPWVEQGKLPNVARLMRDGVHGPLRSTMPPMTFPAWTSFLTGANPGKHGIYDFTRRIPSRYDLEFTNGGHRRAKTFWRLLSDAGQSVISISVPCTYPPEQVNGIMISGFDAAGVGTCADARSIHPPELYDELEREVGGHPIGASIAHEINRGQHEIGLQKVREVVRRKSATTRHLLVNHPWDCAMILFGETDSIGHQFWKYCDTHSPLYSERENLADGIFQIYEECDRQLGEILSCVPEDANIIMMSDHGFGGVGDWLLYPNCWLFANDLLRFRGRVRRMTSRLVDALKLRVASRLPARMMRRVYRLGQRRLGAIEAAVRYSMIDWSGTSAYFDENPYYPFLWINLKGRQPHGTVEPGREYEELREHLINKLVAWRHPDSGEQIVAQAFRREDIYSGPEVEHAPDILVKWGEHQGYTYAFKVSSKSKDLNWLERIDPHSPEGVAFYTGKSGSHRDDGIFAACGPAFQQALHIDGARIIDLAPTILYLAGAPIPASMDGRVLEESISKRFKQGRDPRIDDSDTTGTRADSNGQYSTDDEAVIAERLRSLGYIE